MEIRKKLGTKWIVGVSNPVRQSLAVEEVNGKKTEGEVLSELGYTMPTTEKGIAALQYAVLTGLYYLVEPGQVVDFDASADVILTAQPRGRGESTPEDKALGIVLLVLAKQRKCKVAELKDKAGDKIDKAYVKANKDAIPRLAKMYNEALQSLTEEDDNF